MKLQAEKPPASNTFTGYGEGYVLVNQERITRSVVVMPDRIWTQWEASTFEALAEEHFAALAALDCDVLLLGTGARLRFPKPHLTRPLLRLGRGIEVMDVPAACRTYNLLLNEGRKVAAALLMS